MSVSDSDMFSVSYKKVSHETASATWKVFPNEKILLKTEDRKDTVIISPVFLCFGCIWEIKVTLPSELSKAKTTVSLCLNSICFHIPDRSFYIRIEISDEEKTLYRSFSHERFTKCRTVYAKEIPILSDILITHDKNQSVTISLDIVIPEENTIVASSLDENIFSTDGVLDVRQNSLRSLSQDFEYMYKDLDSTDATLKLGEDVFRAHKFVLMCRSRVFREMFEREFEEARHHTLCIDDADTKTFGEILRYCYSGQVLELTSGEAHDLYMAAHRFELPQLMVTCREIILNGDISGARENCLRTLSDDFKNLCNNPVLPDVNLKLGKNVFQTHKLVLRSRLKAFQALFENDFKDAQHNTVCINEREKKVFKDLLEYIYCGDVRDLTKEEAVELYVLADRYELLELMTICREIIRNS